MKFKQLKMPAGLNGLLLREELILNEVNKLVEKNPREFFSVLILSNDAKNIAKVILDSKLYIPEKVSISVINVTKEKELLKLERYSRDALLFIDTAGDETLVNKTVKYVNRSFSKRYWSQYGF